MDKVIARIIQCELQAEEFEHEAEELKWEAAEKIAFKLAGGMSQRQLAAAIGKSAMHINRMNRCWDWRQRNPRVTVSFNELYHSAEVRGPSASKKESESNTSGASSRSSRSSPSKSSRTSEEDDDCDEEGTDENYDEDEDDEENEEDSKLPNAKRSNKIVQIVGKCSLDLRDAVLLLEHTTILPVDKKSLIRTLKECIRYTEWISENKDKEHSSVGEEAEDFLRSR